jgi:hypothetical protein
MSAPNPQSLSKKGKKKAESSKEATRSLYKADRPKLIINHGIYTTFTNTGVLLKTVVFKSNLYTAFAKNILIYTLKGCGINQYIV